MSSETFDSLAVTAHDEGAERAVLGIMMQGRDATAETRRLIRVEDFFKPQHQAIFAAAARLDDDQKPVEPTAILSELTRSGEAKNAGELAVYLTEVFSDAPAPASLSYYTSLVRDTSTRRALSALGMKMQQMSALDGVENPGEIVERMRSTLDSLAVERLGADVPLAGDIVTSTLEEIDALSKGGMVMGVPTGFTELDTALNGLRPAQMVVVAARPGMGKALALDTPIPTPSGWTTMGELIVGDFVLGRDGKPARVTATTEYQYNRDCFKLVFDDGTSIVADADHQWVTLETGETPILTTHILERFNAEQTVTIPGVEGENLPARHREAWKAAGAIPKFELVSIAPVASVTVRCIQVDNEEHLYLAGPGMIPTHNTAFALDIVRHAAFKVGKSVMMFSLEMSANELMMRALAAEAYVDLQSLKTGQLDDHKWQQLAQATQRIHGSKLGIDDTATVTITDIRAKARAFQRVHGLDMIVIDYIQLMNSDRRSDSRQQEVSEISRGIKLLAKEFGVPVIALSQLNRGSEQRQDKKPQVSDLRESGAIEQDSDVVILLHREEVYEKETPRAGEADVIIAKQRSGPTGTVILSWLGKYSRFDNRSIAGF